MRFSQKSSSPQFSGDLAIHDPLPPTPFTRQVMLPLCESLNAPDRLAHSTIQDT
jgi:hypothetical protein